MPLDCRILTTIRAQKRSFIKNSFTFIEKYVKKFKVFLQMKFYMSNTPLDGQKSEREKFGSRLGFILISAGCAIGLGNVYRFPVTTGAYGGGFFVLIYIAFLILLGIPVMTCGLAVGRASQRSIATSFNVLQKPDQKWGFMKYLDIAGNYLLMMFYTVITCIHNFYLVFAVAYSITLFCAQIKYT